MQKNHLASYININRARSEFFSKGWDSSELVSETIVRSWQRSLAKGVEAFEIQVERPILSPYELGDLTARNQLFLDNSRPILENLFEQIRDTSSMVILTDKTGVILHSIGAIDSVTLMRQGFLQPGVNCTEEAIGTNAIGISLEEKLPVKVFGGEHFAAAFGVFSCSASPVFDPYGNVLGVLDVTGDYRAHQQHTMALVRISTQQIENQMFATGFKEDVHLHFHSRLEFIGSLNEAIAVFTLNGKLKAANNSALRHLGLDRHHSGVDFSDLFSMQFHSLLARAGQIIEFVTRNGVTIYGSLRVAVSNSRRIVTEKNTTAPHAMQTAARLTLEALDLGDAMMRRAIDRVNKVIGQDVTVLLEGESGTGKELFAKAMHNSGPRRNKNFLAMNCAAIPESLIEAELFGYQDGAFTGAKRNGSIGLIRQANGGTLLLDEIGDMPLSLQARLLRVLQERVVTPLGGVEAFPVDIVIICATNRNLRKEITAGRFREDLYYRINGLLVSLPRLRDRQDLLHLAQAITREIAGPGRTVCIREEVTAIMKKHPWPGNIRQLHSVLKTAIALLGSDKEITVEHLPDDFMDQYNESSVHQKADPTTTDNTFPAAPFSLDKIGVMAIKSALSECGNNYSAAARRLGISRNTVYRKLQEDLAR